MEKKNNSFEEIWEKIKGSEKIVMTLHPRPDGDSLGSACAMKYVLERDLGKKVKIVSYDVLESVFNDLSFSKEVDFREDISEVNLENYDLFIAIDCAIKSRLSVKAGANFHIPEKTDVINIDHHHDNSYYGNMNYVRSDKASACNVLVEMFRSLNIEFDRELGKRLLLGICMDTNFFTFDMSPEDAMRDVVFLFDNGVKYVEDILEPIKYRIPLRKAKTSALYIDRLKVLDIGEYKYGYSVIRYEDVKTLGLNNAEIRGPINDLQFIDELDFVFSLTEIEEGIKGSFRSKKGVDVSLFAKELGGGGHKPAAAFNLDKMSLEEAVKKVIVAIERVGVHKV